MKTILGLDLGTSSIGWALVKEAENTNEKSSIVRLGVRITPLTTDEKNNFEKGAAITTSAERTLKRSIRRNLQRFKLRRSALKEILLQHNIINENSVLCENGKFTTHETCRLRAEAARQEVTLEQFARILFAINKKRGYKSSRKANSEDGNAIDGIAVAKYLYENDLTPGEYCYELLSKGKKYLPDFYRSDLENELNKIWDFQSKYYPEYLTNEFKQNLNGKSQTNCTKTFLAVHHIYTAENKGNDKKIQSYKWRSMALKEQLPIEEVAYVICHICGEINGSSGYLGAISDRSKILYFNNQTVGEYKWKQLSENKHHSLKNQAFYRQDYLDEFETIWETQAQYHSELTPQLKKDIRDIIIFYQRPLKSKKSLLGVCELEGKNATFTIDGKEKSCLIGPKVCPKSSPIFQEFRIWQRLNDTRVTISEKSPITHRKENFTRELTLEEKKLIASELLITDKLSKKEVLKLIFKTDKDKDLNFKAYEGNTTYAGLFEKYLSIVELTGHELPSNIKYANEKITAVKQIFDACGYNSDILSFNSTLDSQACYEQSYYMLWHLLYSYEGDNSKTGIEKLIDKIASITHLEREFAAMLATITYKPDYSNLSSKAMHKILPYMLEGNDYALACEYAGYRHSKDSLTKEELDARPLKNRLDILPKNSLRNPVVEKILNQMIHVVNGVIEQYGAIDEIRIELARELKHSASERADMFENINKATKEHENIKRILTNEFNIAHPSRNDIIRYRLYKELEPLGYKTLYSNTYIPKEKLFSKDFDIEHIIPRSRLFDDSFSNKTLEARDINIEKGNMTAYDFVHQKYGENSDWGITTYESRIESLFKSDKISKAKYNKLKMREANIPQDFIERDLRNSQYIAREAMRILHQVVRSVIPTVGAITSRLREDWQLIDVMQELNWDKYDKLGLTTSYQDHDGRTIKQIKDWTKRNDHRHHAMDALTIAFTKKAYVQYLNNMNARSDKSSDIYAIEHKELERNNNGKLRFKSPIYPIESFRQEALKHLQMTLVSIKAKNKVATTNINKSKKQGGYNKKTQLTPRGQLHLETTYGRRIIYSYEEKVIGGTFTYEVIERVVSSTYRQALHERLSQNNGDAKKAFTGKNSIDKNPIYIGNNKEHTVPQVVKLRKEEIIYTNRKEISPNLNIDKVADPYIKTILQERLKAYDNDAKKAFSDLDNNPIWLNKEKGIAIKRVTLKGLNNAISLHEKRNHFGAYLKDSNGNHIPTDYVNTGNNHHVAIYRDANGKLQENIVSFIEATTRHAQGIPIVDKEYNKALGWTFLFTMKQNEYFIFPDEKSGFYPNEIDLKERANYAHISPHLYRVQKFSTKNYVFRHHLETNVEKPNELRDYTWKRITNLSLLEGIVKVRINHIGEIVKIGEE